MQRFAHVRVLLLLSCCAPPKKPATLNIGFMYAIVAGDFNRPAAELAAQHVNDAGGVRGRLVSVKPLNYGGTDAGSGLQRLMATHDVKAAIIATSSEIYSYDDTMGLLPGGGATAASVKVPIFCTGCTSPIFDDKSVQAQLGATVDGLDAACVATPLQCDQSKGSITRSGYVYRLMQSHTALMQELADMMADDKVSVVGGVTDPLSTTDMRGTVEALSGELTARGVTYARSAVPATRDGAGFSAAYAAAIADAGGKPIDGVFVNTLFTNYVPFFTDAWAGATKKLPVYCGYWARIGDIITGAGETMVGAKGVAYVMAHGPSPGTFADDVSVVLNLPANIIQDTLFTDGSYDAVILFALAAYASGSADPTPEEIKNALDKLNDPQGTHVGYKEFAKAKQILDAGGTINYDGVSGTLDFDLSNGVKSAFEKWTVVDAPSGPTYQDTFQ